MKVLVVDDDPLALAVVRARLKVEELEIVPLADGRQAVAVALRERPDLILLDVDMPGVSGFEVCGALKSEPELRLVPVVFLSALARTGDKVRGLDHGAVDYITKPFDAFELRARVRAALRTKHLQDLLAEHAHIDVLTGIPNRRGLMDRLRREWARARRHSVPLALVLADVDHFKAVNDAHGHLVGDKVLQAVARALASECRVMDLPGRYGGDEFAIVVPDEPAERAVILAERCRRNIESVRVQAGEQTVQPTASFGVTDSGDAASVEALLQAADRSLYAAKEAGRNTVVCSDRRLLHERPGDAAT